MVEQIGLNDPIELLMGGSGGDVLVKTLSEIGRGGCKIAALREVGALAQRGPRVDINGSRHVEVRSEGLIDANEKGLRVNPFVARGLKRIMIQNIGQVRRRDQGNKLGSNRATQRIGGGDDIGLSCD